MEKKEKEKSYSTIMTKITPPNHKISGERKRGGKKKKKEKFGSGTEKASFSKALLFSCT